LAVGNWKLVINIAKASPNCSDPSSITSNDDRDYCVAEIERLKNLYLPAQEANKKDLAGLQSQLTDLNKRIQAMLSQLKIFASNIAKREEDLGFAQKVLDEKTKGHYVFLRLYDPISSFIFSDTASQAFQENSLLQKTANEDIKTIEQYAGELTQLKVDKASLEKNQVSLAAVQKEVADKTSFLASEVAKVDTYLASLSAKQQSFLAAKLESLGLSRSAYNMKGGCSSDISPFKDPGFGSPYYAFFTYGVPNRVGMNQFGAKGRAEQGQLYPQILSAYYNADLTTGNSQSTNIHIVGRNEFGESIDKNWTIEEYLTHLYEMPTNFPTEALKAQAIAARSYALAYTNNGSGSICPSQQCQVVKLGAHDSNDAWSQAVRDTAGVVLKSGGQPIKAWFSSTHGGYAYTTADIGWSSTSWTKRLQDTTGGVSSFSDLMNNAYDKSSPVFYCDWGSRTSANKTAWLKPDELADIVNAVLLVKKDGSTKPHLYQTDKPNPEGTDTWDVSTVKSKLSSLGGTPIDSVTNVSIGVDFGMGRTITVTVNGQSISGDDFKNYFNLRAPSNIQIVGPLFNVEKH